MIKAFRRTIIYEQVRNTSRGARADIDHSSPYPVPCSYMGKKALIKNKCND